jgi:replicative DNA helicase
MKKNLALSILGYLTYKPEEFPRVAEELTPEMFGASEQLPREMAEAVWAALTNAQPFTPADLRDLHEGSAEIALKNPATGGNIEAAVQNLKSNYERRQTAAIYQEAAMLAAKQDALTAQSYADAKLEDLRKGMNYKDKRLEVIQSSYELTSRIMNRDKTKEVTGVDTGFSNLNLLTSGWQPKTMTVIAARPGMGKTTYTIQSAIAAAMEGHPVLYFSCGDTGAEQLYQKAACVLANIAPGNLRKGMFTDADRDAIVNAYGKISDLPLTVYDNSLWNGTVGGIRDIARRASREWTKTGLIVVDYIQQVEPERPSRDRVENIRMVSAGLQKLAKQLDVPLISISQLSRGIEARNTEPRLSDLRGSGDIEQDADLIFFIYDAPLPDGGVQRCLLCKKDRQGDLYNPAEQTVAKMDWLTVEGRYRWKWDTGYINRNDMPF